MVVICIVKVILRTGQYRVIMKFVSLNSSVTAFKYLFPKYNANYLFFYYTSITK